MLRPSYNSPRSASKKPRDVQNYQNEQKPILLLYKNACAFISNSSQLSKVPTNTKVFLCGL